MADRSRGKRYLPPGRRGKAAYAVSVLIGVALATWAGSPLAWPQVPGVDDPWADSVVAYNAIDANPGFNDPARAVGKPTGGTTGAPDNTGVHSIGRPGPAPGSYILLKFDTPVEDDPRNPMGLDCIVYGNAFWVGGNPLRKWVEPMLIEISEDVNGNGLPDDPWYVIPGSRNLPASVRPEGIPNPAPPLAGNVLNPNSDGTEYDWGYGELNPTQQEYLDNYVRPDDPFRVGLTPRSGGGDAFDIAWAVDANGQPAGLTRFHFIRLSAFIAGATGIGTITPEIDAVADVAPDVDTDGDGILDEYETRWAGTDPNRPESTVLALEIPAEEGGSPAGTLLGEATRGNGDRIALYSRGPRSGIRAFNSTVDILDAADPAPSVPVTGLIRSGVIREFRMSIADCEAAGIRDAEFTVAYSSADIAGLEETALQPFRYDGTGWSQDGIGNLSRDPVGNTLTFTSRYPGVFTLASTAGPGDVGSSAPPLVLTVTGTARVGNPGTSVAVTSGPVLDAQMQPVPDGTVFTVDGDLLAVETPDVDPVAPGTQVAVAGGTLTAMLRGDTRAGTARVRLVSLDGLIEGVVEIPVLPGDPAGPVDIYLLNPPPRAPGLLYFQSDPIRDPWGNTLIPGTRVTVVVEGGAVTTPDADPVAPGRQVTLSSAGMAAFTVAVDRPDAKGGFPLVIALYADPAGTSLLGEATWTVETEDSLPVSPVAAALLVPGLLTPGLYRLFRRRPRVERRP
ncbi:MAG: hypothetical protein KBH78_01270 [Candidatus Hydrogenedentes bacterium]|nr:hypothetical protein [Candidatus Hydrogenedentota bacterium]